MYPNLSGGECIMEKTRDHILINRHFSDLNPILLGSEACACGKSFGPAVRKYVLLHYVVSGKGVFHKAGVDYPVGAGEAFLILPDEVTLYTADENDPWYYQWIAFDGMLSEKFRQLPPVFAMRQNWVKEMIETEESEMREYLIASLLFRMYADFFVSEKSKHRYIKQVKTYIRAMYMQDIRVEEIAQKMNLDRRYLSRVFKANTGISIKEYLVEVRMEEAKRCLEKGGLVTETAHLCGYDTCNFSKMFKRRFGMSPQEWQRKHLG